MSSRILIAALCLGAIALACGPRTHNDTSAPTQSRAAHAQTTTQRAAAVSPRKQKPKVTAQLSVQARSTSVHFALQVVNRSRKAVELTFPNGQTYDFIVLDSVGRELWRWGADRMFTQALRNTPLGGGETLDIEETWSGATLPPGRYIARGVLASENYAIAEQTEFTIHGSTIASR